MCCGLYLVKDPRRSTVLMRKKGVNEEEVEQTVGMKLGGQK